MSKFGLPEYPKRASRFHRESTVLVGNAIAPGQDANQSMQTVWYQSTAANGDSWTLGFNLRKGTYTLSLMSMTGTSRGKLDLYLDDVLVASRIDFYSASTAYNVIKTVAVTAGYNGWHVLKGVVNGKNDSSSGYVIHLSLIWFAQAVD